MTTPVRQMTTPTLEASTPPVDNWLTYHGNAAESVGTLMPERMDGWKHVTVMAAVYEPDFEWPDGRKGRTRLGVVEGDARATGQSAIQATYPDGRVVTFLVQEAAA